MSEARPPVDPEEAKEMLEALNLQAGVADMESGSEGEEGGAAVAGGSGASGKPKKKRNRRKGKTGGAASSEPAPVPSEISSDVVEALEAAGPAVPTVRQRVRRVVCAGFPYFCWHAGLVGTSEGVE
jgi:hypothetical protein